MTVTSLSRIVNEGFIKAITQAGTSASSSRASSTGTSLGQKTQVSLSSGLRSGARDFGAGSQLLNNGISVINIARAANEKLLEIVGKLDQVVGDAARSGVTAGKAKRLQASFTALSRDFNRLLKETAEQKTDVFDPADVSAFLSRAGLEQKNVNELELAFKKITPLSDSRVDSQGNVTSSANLIPKVEFLSSLKRAVTDPEDPLAEEATGGFSGVKEKMKKLREMLHSNIKALDDTSEVVGRNLKLVRVVGLAMLDLSSSIPSNSTAASVAEELQTRIRQQAPLLLGEAHNLQAIAVAGLMATSSKTSG